MRTANTKTLFAISVFFLVTASAALGKIIYVDADATGANDGSSWADAYNSPQDALADANSAVKPVEIRVAEGIYTPDSNSADPNGTGDRTATFQLINDVALKGGYTGFGQPDPNGRDIELYETILSGDLDGNDVDVNDPCDLETEPTRSENSYHVLTGSGTDETAILDGFIIKGGNANSLSTWKGGGMYCDGDPVLNNCTFILNSAADSGGGMYNSSGSNPTLTNCTFANNSAYTGGGMQNYHSAPVLVNCTFRQNWARGGGGMDNWRSNVILTNCTFAKNSAPYDGGGVCNGDSWLMLTNCIFIRNSTGRRGGGFLNWVEDYESHATLINCTFSGNSAERGGGMYNDYDDIYAELINCTFSNNSAEYNGGGIYNFDSSLTLTNCVFSGNSAEWGDGGGIYNYGGIYSYCSDTIVTGCTFNGNRVGRYGGAICAYSEFASMGVTLVDNCILWGDEGEICEIEYAEVAVTYSDVQGGWWRGGEGNIDVDPCFADPGYWDANNTPEDANDDFWVDGDYHLESQAGRWEPNTQSWIQDDVTSLCIDAGDMASPIGLEPFPNGGIINIGAYGGTAKASKSYFGEPLCETIVAGDINGDCKVDFKDFALMAYHWLEER